MSSDSIEIFATAARAYCQFVQTASTLAVPERIATAQVHLLDVYRAALSLYELEPGSSEIPEIPENPPLAFGDHDRYWKVVSQLARSEPVAASISDDMLLVYRYLQRGLALWDGDRKAAAGSEWRRHFDAHWSDHAVDAIRALHRASGVRVQLAAPAFAAVRMASTSVASSPSAPAAPAPPPQQASHLDEAQIETLRAALSALGRTVNDGLIALQAGRQLPPGAHAPNIIDPSAPLDVRLKEFLHLIHAQMKLIRNGDPAFGSCAKCHGPIPYHDLEFEPWLPRHSGCWAEE